MDLKQKVRNLQSDAQQPAILVVGDLMIDRYIWGNASRLSPEAPVPIVNVKDESITLGGAGNVVQNLVTLGARVTVAGVIGDDAAGSQLVSLLETEGVKTSLVIKDAARPTTVKTRVLAGMHQLVRIDRETTAALTASLEDELIDKITAVVAETSLVILSDYNKGLFSPAFTRRLIEIASRFNKKVVIDPKGLHYEKYNGAYLIKPNRKELAEVAKVESIKTTEELRHAAETVFEQTGTTYLVVTLSEEGMAILTKDSSKLLPVKATEVFDVTGAGDTVIAAISYFLARGLAVEEACELANHAAAIVVRHVGSATTTVDEIMRDME